jgi:hypothetical protein
MCPALWLAEHDQHSPSGGETRTLARLLKRCLLVAGLRGDLRSSELVVTARARCVPLAAGWVCAQRVPPASRRGEPPGLGRLAD